MKIPSEAELIQMEKRARYYTEVDDCTIWVDRMARDVLMLVALIREWENYRCMVQRRSRPRSGRTQAMAGGGTPVTVNLEEHPPT